MTENIAMLMAQVSRLLRRAFDEKARTIGVTRPQWQVLTLLTVHEGINQGGLAEMLEVEPITLGRMIDRLQEAEMVQRRPDPTDRRAWRLYLTDKARELLEQLRPMADDMLEVALVGVDGPVREAMMEALRRMRANLTRRPAGQSGNG